jgi:carnitine O-acetyltransferase|tara:strand:- start:39 stop:200 length:162 start_codon:yes stop_codon:yes gene_type:complete
MVISMARNEKTSSKVATLAAKGLKDPGSLTKAQIKTISGSVLTQAPDKPKRRK